VDFVVGFWLRRLLGSGFLTSLGVGECLKRCFFFGGFPGVGFMVRILALLDWLGGVIISCSIVVCGVVLKGHRQ